MRGLVLGWLAVSIFWLEQAEFAVEGWWPFSGGGEGGMTLYGDRGDVPASDDIRVGLGMWWEIPTKETK